MARVRNSGEDPGNEDEGQPTLAAHVYHRLRRIGSVHLPGDAARAEGLREPPGFGYAAGEDVRP